MLRTLALLLLPILLAGPGPAAAAETRYISDEIYVPLRAGPGSDFRWLGRLTPGTRLTMGQLSRDGKWAEVTTGRGATGWVRKEYLSRDKPAQLKLPEAEALAASLSEKNTALKAELETERAEKQALLEKLNGTGSELDSVSEELTHLKQVSGKAVQLDEENRRLVAESEILRSEQEMLEAENLRLQEKLKSEDFINGALAVLLGVIITLVVPRLWPRRRKSSSWA